MRNPKTPLWAQLVLIAILAAQSAGASDGEIEISQASVLAAGGFPLVISEPGSYRLTSNLTVSGPDGIEATVAGVRLDLGGFSIVGPGSCTAAVSAGSLLTDVTCTGNSGTGLLQLEEARNGTVRGFIRGLFNLVGRSLRVADLTVRENRFEGIFVQGDLIATESSFLVNGLTGLVGTSATARVIVRNSVFSQNGSDGLFLGSGVAQGSVFAQNKRDGLRSGSRGGAVSHCYFELNGVGVVSTSSLGLTSNAFFGNTVHFTGATNLGANVCDGALCP